MKLSGWGSGGLVSGEEGLRNISLMLHSLTVLLIIFKTVSNTRTKALPQYMQGCVYVVFPCVPRSSKSRFLIISTLFCQKKTLKTNCTPIRIKIWIKNHRPYVINYIQLIKIISKLHFKLPHVQSGWLRYQRVKINWQRVSSCLPVSKFSWTHGVSSHCFW